MPLQYGTPYPQNWYMEGGSVECSRPEAALCTADIEKESHATLEAGRLLFLRFKQRSILILQRGHATASTTIQCLLFATCGDVMPIWATTIRDGEPDALHLPHLFPNGYQSYRISLFPILNSPMLHDWRIYVTQSPENGQLNDAIGQRLGAIWRGNIVLAKYGNVSYSEKDWLKNIRHESSEFAIVLLDAWFKQCYVTVQCDSLSTVYPNVEGNSDDNNPTLPITYTANRPESQI